MGNRQRARPDTRRPALLKSVKARGASNLAKPELGTKRECPSCGAKFYDLNKNPLICPKCEHEFVPEVAKASKKAKPAAEKPKKEPEKPAPSEDDDDDDTSAGDISLEELEDDFDDDSDDDDDIDLDDDDSDDDAFLEDDEDEDDDVSGIVRGGKGGDDD